MMQNHVHMIGPVDLHGALYRVAFRTQVSDQCSSYNLIEHLYLFSYQTKR